MTSSTYGGFIVAPPWAGGFGFGAYINGSGQLYFEGYYGTPGMISLSAGYSNNVEQLLTGLSAGSTLVGEAQHLRAAYSKKK
jgi:hypothetical protein